ncbi:hypothetical protein GMORB2_5827 [Geosmithia morbida]|uniref:Uncharacterized protein n=1 Tax=Geosmithia morbida TaxID=1094350 RepID=A0A9P5D517_9HYPO|nr:uncharacterized protein GMORB2_5827 [Geosmithia morbida]KAF4124111.1 hypothetical protein GMORB2_5827 [Geosmithia morbida]
MEQQLLHDLRRKLDDLEHKVQVYRHELAVEFQTFCHQTLADVAPSTALDIENALAASYPTHPLLGPELQASNNTTIAASTSAVTIPAIPEHDVTATVGTGGIGSHSAIDVAAAPAGRQHSSSQEPLPRQGGKMNQPGESTDVMQLLVRPAHVRTSTGGTTSSSLSDNFSAKLPRSALRRPLSSPRPHQASPRRVRFEFGGHEVLPTSSPRDSDFEPLRQVSSVVQGDIPGHFDKITGKENGPDVVSEPTEFDPPPRKISSSEALRALSRAPLDESTVWTVVNPDNSSEAAASTTSTEVPIGWGPEESSSVTPVPPPASTSMPVVEGSGIRQLTAPFRSTKSIVASDDIQSDDSSDDGDFLSMAKPISFESKSSIGLARAQTRGSTQTAAAPLTPPASKRLPSKTQDEEKELFSSEDYDDDDDMFEFETGGGLTAPPKPKKRTPAFEDDTSEATGPPYGSATARDDVGPVEAPLASPGVPIARPRELESSSSPSTLITSKFEARSLGSYMGRPLMMPVVKNPELHAQAASLGDFNTFVGGLDGRSGVDEGDLNSFRASLSRSVRFSGTPRSLTERMMMEDAEEEVKQNGRQS